MKRFLPVVFLSLLALWACATKPAPDKTCYPKVVVLKGVNFDFNKSALKPESYTVLNENLAMLASRPKMTITIIGHTDSDGNEAYNQKLSLGRAIAVMQYFAEKGIAANRMQAVGKGESTPIADNRTESGKALNRRIEIEFNDPDPDIICK